jgi:cytochrome c oxidase cbb3-type subunit III
LTATPFANTLSDVYPALQENLFEDSVLVRSLLIFLSSLFLFAAYAEPSAQAPSAQNAPVEKPDLTAGKVIFEGHCSLCHGIDGGGGRGPSLHHPKLSRAADDKALKSLIENGIPPEMPEGWYLSEQDISNVVAFVRSLGSVPPEKLPGDPQRGEAIYARSGCATCHILAGRGTGFGPELTEVGARRGAARLRGTLLSPSKTIPEDFLLIEAITSSGETIRGIRLNEDTFTIQLKDAQGHFYSLRKNDLHELKKLRGETPMPSYESLFSAAELDDLVAYLASQRGQP